MDLDFIGLFIHVAGIIVGLGAVTVIDTLGFISRKSKEWTQVTIQAHHVTKPLIWLGSSLMIVGWLLVYEIGFWSTIKSWTIVLLVLNGGFLSFYVSPRLDLLKGKKVLLPSKLQTAIAVSMVVSFVSWWSLVLITVWSLV